MPITDDLRTQLTKATPLYFAAGTADLAAEKLREVPELLTQLRAQAPERLAAFRQTGLTTVREHAQSLAVRSVGRAAEYAVKARETYDELAERGRGAVETWRGEPVAPRPGTAGEAAEAGARVEREPRRADEPAAEPAQPTPAPPRAAAAEPSAERSAAVDSPAEQAGKQDEEPTAPEARAQKPAGQRSKKKAASPKSPGKRPTTQAESPDSDA